MTYDCVLVEKEAHLVTVTINRPEALNALHPQACEELDEIFNQFSDDPDAWVAILTGSGDRAFCAGMDLKWQAKHGGDVVRERMSALKGGWGGITKRFDCFKPIIAAVNGYALGGGFELALASDIIVASENATFGLPEPRVGMMAAAGGVNRLPRQIPFHLAMGLMITGRRISAQEAYRIGIVNEVVPKGELMKVAKRWAGEVLECSPLAVWATKEAALEGLNLPYRESIGKLYPGYQKFLDSEDHVEGPLSFSEKRKPIWKGK